MSLYLGRKVIDGPHSFFFPNPDQLSITGEFAESTQAATFAARDDILGMALQKELIALRWDEEPEVDGYYVVEGASAEVRNVVTGGGGWVAFSVRLRRMATEAVVLYSKLVGAQRSVHSNWTPLSGIPVPWHAVPTIADAGTTYYQKFAQASSHVSRVGENATISVLLGIDETDNPRWAVPPANYYDGAATLESPKGTVRSSRLVQSAPTDWQLSNDLVRISPNIGDSLPGQWVYEQWNGSDWTTATYKFQAFALNWLNLAYKNKRIVRCNPEEVAIQLYGTVQGASFPVAVTLRLRRGSLLIEGTVECADVTQQLAFGLTANNPADHLTDSAGWIDTTTGQARYIMVSALADTESQSGWQHLVETSGANGKMDFGFGMVPDSPQSGDSGDELHMQYLYSLTEHVRAGGLR